MARDVRVRITGDNGDLLNSLAASLAGIKAFADQVGKLKSQMDALHDSANRAGDALRGAGRGGSGGGSGGGGLDQARSSADGLTSSLGAVAIKCAVVVYALKQVADAVVSIAKPGFDLTKDMETNELGIAGIIQAMTTLNGKAVDFNTAMQESRKTTKDLQADAIRTGATMQELVGVYRAILAPGLSSGMSFEDIRKLSTMGANAVKAIMPNDGRVRMQMIQEIRDLVQGGIQASSSTLATSLGITDADITKAKNSAEGLFKFLMDRLQGFQDVSNAFPDTLQGKMDNLQEVATLASAEITKEFEGDFKNLITWVTSLFGELDTKAGTLKINPEVLATLKSIRRECSDWYDIIKQMNANSLFGDAEPFMKGLKDVYGIAKNIVSMFVDLEVALERISGLDFLGGLFGKGLSDLLADLREATDKIAIGWKYLSGRKDTASPDGSSLTNPNIAGDGIRTISTGNDDSAQYKQAMENRDWKAKYGNSAKQAELAQAALKQTLDDIKSGVEGMKKKISEDIKELDVVYAQSGDISLLSKKADLERQLAQLEVDRITQSIEAVKAADFKKDSTKDTKLNELENDLKIAVSNLAPLSKAMSEVSTVLSVPIKANEGTTWRRETSNVNIEGLNQDAKDAITALSVYAQKLLGEQMVVSSGLRTGENAGGHVSGSKFDMVDSADSTTLEKNKDGIRDQIIAYAESIGLSVLDEYKNPSRLATGGHLDFNAKGFQGLTTDNLKSSVQNSIYTKSGAESFKARLALEQKNLDNLRGLATGSGNDAGVLKADLKSKYADMIKVFTANSMSDAVENAKKLLELESMKIDLAQIKKGAGSKESDLSLAQQQLAMSVTTQQSSLVDGLAQFKDKYNGALSGYLDTLRLISAKAKSEGWTPLAQEADAELLKLQETLRKGIASMLAAADVALQDRIDSINNNLDLTTGQKEDRIKKLNLQASADKVATLKDAVANPNLSATDKMSFQRELDKAEQLNNSLTRMADINYRVGAAAKQSFEDGLLTFLTDGITKCDNLADAFRNLAISVLSSIQRIYAEAVSKNIMGMLGMGDSVSEKGSTKGFSYTPTLIKLPTQHLAEGGAINSGLVRGPGTSVSDSILAYASNLGSFLNISDGEGIINGKAMRKMGVSALNALNSGMDPKNIFKSYATGGSLVGANTGTMAGPQDVAASLSSGDTNVHLKNVNVFDSNQIGNYISSKPGEKVMVNWMKNNASVTRTILGIKA